MTKTSAPAHLVIKGKVKGAPQIAQQGTAVVVTKTLDDGATLTEKFPKRRARGKQKVLDQAIPAEDVLRTIEEATQSVAEAVAGSERGKAKKQIDGIQALANKMMDGQSKALAKAERKTKRAAQQAVAAKSELKKTRSQPAAPSFGLTLARHMNGRSHRARVVPDSDDE